MGVSIGRRFYSSFPIIFLKRLKYQSRKSWVPLIFSWAEAQNLNLVNSLQFVDCALVTFGLKVCELGIYFNFLVAGDSVKD